MSQLLSSVLYICFRKTSGSNIGAPNLLHAPGAIKPRYAPACRALRISQVQHCRDVARSEFRENPAKIPSLHSVMVLLSV